MSKGINTSVLVDEVKKRPIFYDRKHPHYGDRAANRKAWREVAQLAVQNWESMNATLQAAAEKRLRCKWRHMRDYFVKELKTQNERSNGAKRRRSAYFRKMLFLVPVMESNKRLTYISPEAIQLKTEEIICEPEGPSDQNFDDTVGSSGSFHHDDTNLIDSGELHPPDPLGQSTLGTVHSDIPDMNPSHDGQNFMSCEEDYDKMFLLSLLPSLRQVPENMKLQVRIDMQQVLATALRANNNQR